MCTADFLSRVLAYQLHDAALPESYEVPEAPEPLAGVPVPVGVDVVLLAPLVIGLEHRRGELCGVAVAQPGEAAVPRVRVAIGALRRVVHARFFFILEKSVPT